jgi:hypothetical protein
MHVTLTARVNTCDASSIRISAQKSQRDGQGAPDPVLLRARFLIRRRGTPSEGLIFCVYLLECVEHCFHPLLGSSRLFFNNEHAAIPVVADYSPAGFVQVPCRIGSLPLKIAHTWAGGVSQHSGQASPPQVQGSILAGTPSLVARGRDARIFLGAKDWQNRLVGDCTTRHVATKLRWGNSSVLAFR